MIPALFLIISVTLLWFFPEHKILTESLESVQETELATEIIAEVELISRPNRAGSGNTVQTLQDCRFKEEIPVRSLIPFAQ